MPCDGHMRYECVIPYDMKASYVLVIFLVDSCSLYDVDYFMLFQMCWNMKLI